MKTKIQTTIATLFIFLLMLSPVMAQEEPPMPAYITITTLYWNLDREQTDSNDWMAIEKEYLEKVTRKNEYVMAASYYMHLYTENSTESKYVQTYASWADIEKAQKRNTELEKLAWPDEAKRNAFLNNRQSFYIDFHSDEIYVPLEGGKYLTERPKEDMVTYVRISKMAFPSDGSNEEFMKLHKQFINTTVMKNDKIKAYYPNVHGWGADKTDFVEAYYIESLDDLNDLNAGNADAIKAQWPDEEARKAFFKSYNKYFTGVHGDYLYTYIAELSK
jgi:hypothetical protein